MSKHAETNFDPYDRSAIETLAYIGELRRANSALLEACRALLDRYVSLVECGDCGNWNPETEPQVIQARAAIAIATNEGDNK